MLRKFIDQRTLRVLSWSSLISQIIIVSTGGAVRLTGSGLGCPTWPNCTVDSLVTVPAMGIHGVIEFSNRMLTFVLILIALAQLLLVFALKLQRTLRTPAIALLAGIFAQAIIGGISVRMKLNPWIVGLHFLISAVMIAVASIQLWRTYAPKNTGSSKSKNLSVALLSSGLVTLLIGVIVTGSGPHAGDSKTPRNGFNPELMQHLHSYPAYLTLGLALVLMFRFRRLDVDGYSSRLLFWTVVTLAAQAGLGVVQARMGLPIWMVLAHMTLAAVLCSLLTLQYLSVSAKQ